MGGHGGLNILPQKSWNVYGRENRLKVARDEAKHAEEQRAKAEKQRLAEGEARRAFLLRQAAIKRGGAEPHGAEQAQLATQPEEQGAGLLQHINFFQEHEARELNPEVVEEGRKEARRRGDMATQTSDARFDERFQFGHGLTGSKNEPWYAKKGPSLLSEPEQELAQRMLDDGRPLSLPRLPGSAQPGQASLDQQQRPARLLLPPADAKHARSKDKRKEKRRDKDKKAKKDRGSRKQESRDGKALDIQRLREERQRREALERERARQAVMGGNGGGGPGKGKSFHGAYGNVAPSKRPVSAA